MSLSAKNLSAIQKAGQAVHGAADAIAQTLSTQAQSAVVSAASNLLGAAFDQAIARLKNMARLSQGLNAMEAQLRDLYSLALELASPVSDVVIALPSVAKRKATNAAAVDVVAKPAKPERKKPRSVKASKRSKEPGALTANDTKLLQHLQAVLKADEWTALTGAAMATGSGLPLGSVGVSLKKVLSTGAVKTGERGQYQLGTPASAKAEAPIAPDEKPQTSKRKVK